MEDQQVELLPSRTALSMLKSVDVGPVDADRTGVVEVGLGLPEGVGEIVRL